MQSLSFISEFVLRSVAKLDLDFLTRVSKGDCLNFCHILSVYWAMDLWMDLCCSFGLVDFRSSTAAR